MVGETHPTGMGRTTIYHRVKTKEKGGTHMRDVIVLEDAYHKDKVIIRHKKDVSITRETRKDHMVWRDRDGNRIVERNYIVVTFPSTMGAEWSKWSRSEQDKWQNVFKRSEADGMTELLFYDDFTFTWFASLLEDIGIAKVTHLSYPGRKQGYFLPVYVDAHGFWQLGYNLVTLLIQSPFIIQAERRYQIEQREKEQEKRGASHDQS